MLEAVSISLFSVIAYGLKTWPLTKPLERILINSQGVEERSMLGTILKKKKRIKQIRKQTRVRNAMITFNQNHNMAGVRTHEGDTGNQNKNSEKRRSN